jgi:hypothetical protein
MRTLPDGTKGFYYRYFADGVKRLVLIGTFDGKGQRSWRGVRGDRMTFAAAREDARNLGDLIAEHGDIDAYEEDLRRKAEHERQVAERMARQGSFGQLLDSYSKQLGNNGNASAKAVENAIKLHIKSPFPNPTSATQGKNAAN